MRARVAVAIVAAGLLTGALAQTVPTVRFTTPELEYKNTFSSIINLREMSGDRVLLLDFRETRFALANLRTGAEMAVGRKGQGPGEWSGLQPLIFPAGGDTSLVWDQSKRGFLLVLPDGRMEAGPLLPRTPSRTALDSGKVNPDGVDPRWRAYFSQITRPDIGVPAQAAGPDSIPLLREDLRTFRVDTVAFLRVEKRPPAALYQPTITRQPLPPGATPVVTTSPLAARLAMPYPFDDSYAVGADGRVAVIRAADYRVEWFFPDGRHVIGPPTPYEKLPVSAQERQQLTDQARAQGVPPPILPDAKPPFRAWDVHFFLIDPDGNLWLQRLRPSMQDRMKYDVFDPRGVLVKHAELELDQRFQGVGRGVAYVARLDSDDLLHLRRYRVP